MRKKCCRFGIGLVTFVVGIFTALILPIWLIAAIEGALIIILSFKLLKK